MIVEDIVSNCKMTQMSMIGTGKDYPVSWGNYFWIKEGRVLNMWYENLEDAKDMFCPDGVKIKVYTEDEDKNYTWVIIDDPRIPPEYYYNKLCFTGCGRPSKEIGKAIYDHLGDPDNEYLQFEDPVAYYKKKGGSYDPKTGIITYNLAPKGYTETKTGILMPTKTGE